MKLWFFDRLKSNWLCWKWCRENESDWKKKGHSCDKLWSLWSFYRALNRFDGYGDSTQLHNEFIIRVAFDIWCLFQSDKINKVIETNENYNLLRSFGKSLMSQFSINNKMNPFYLGLVRTQNKYLTVYRTNRPTNNFTIQTIFYFRFILYFSSAPNNGAWKFSPWANSSIQTQTIVNKTYINRF